MGMGSSGRGCGGCCGMSASEVACANIVQQSACPMRNRTAHAVTFANTRDRGRINPNATPFLQGSKAIVQMKDALQHDAEANT